MIVSSNNLNLKYERFTRLGCLVTGNRKLVAKPQFLLSVSEGVYSYSFIMKKSFKLNEMKYIRNMSCSSNKQESIRALSHAF